MIIRFLWDDSNKNVSSYAFITVATGRCGSLGVSNF